MTSRTIATTWCKNTQGGHTCQPSLPRRHVKLKAGRGRERWHEKDATYILTAIPRLEAPYFHIAVRNVDWGNGLLQVYRVNWSRGYRWFEYCFILVKFAADPSASATVHSIHPPPPRAHGWMCNRHSCIHTTTKFSSTVELIGKVLAHFTCVARARGIS